MKLQDFLSCEKVRCVSSYCESLTKGKEYMISSVDYISVCDDEGDMVCLDSDLFEPVIDDISKPAPKIDTSANSVDTQATDDLDSQPMGAQTVSGFEAGDPVYWGLKSRIFKIHRFISANVLEVELDGGVTAVHKDELCPATQENYEKLCSLFERIDFEAPPKPLTGSDLARAMLDAGHEYVVGRVGNHVGVYCMWSEGAGHFFEVCGTGTFDVEPIDPRTGNPLTAADVGL